MSNHASSENDNLLLIKASAGSGKTYRLTQEYLKLLFSSDNKYKHILAVTFTNKATEEMKSRIVKELFCLASGEKSDYLSILTDYFSISETKVRNRAKKYLSTILHDYSSFTISTIDRFFQQVMRAFTHEMRISEGYNIELDIDTVLSDIIDLILSELDKTQNKALSGWLLEFMKENVKEGKKWNIRRDLDLLSRELLKEQFVSISDEEKKLFYDKQFLNKYRILLHRMVSDFEQPLREIGQRAVSLMKQYNLEITDFKYGKTSGLSWFHKLAAGKVENPSKRVVDLQDNEPGWYSPKSDRIDDIVNIYNNGLNDCLKDAIGHMSDNRSYHSARAVLNNFYTVGILSDIQNRLREYQQENNILFLSDTTELLNKFICDSDSPFIYEKTGTRISNYMIDEFQDTSSMQWENFRPLMNESLSNNNFNLIVGDVKQSIYRWRNSDWNLLNSKAESDLENSTSVNKITLDTNWRSDINIVNFNNSIFLLGSTILQNYYNRYICENYTEDIESFGDICTKIADVYAEVTQKESPAKKSADGYVKITFLDNTDTDWRDEALKQLPLEIDRLQDQGFALKDIAILIRTAKEAITVANYLLEYKNSRPDSKYRYDIISNEALLIGRSQSIKTIIAILRHFGNPKNETLHRIAIYEFYRFYDKQTVNEAINATFNGYSDDFEPEIKKQLNDISTLSFYEMIENFFVIYKDALKETENAYVQAFLDIVLKFNSEKSSNLSDFLEWWDEKGSKKTLFSPDKQDAIRLITVHKSKGLEFDAVIMPFVNWKTDHNPLHKTIIWCRPQEKPFNTFPIVPLQYAKSLTETIFDKDYLKEKLFTYIDNINILYVAFTRARKRLIAYAPQVKELATREEKVEDMSQLLWQCLINDNFALPQSEIFSRKESEKNLIFEYGSPVPLNSRDEDRTVSEKYKSTGWQSIPFADRLKLRLNSTGFFSDDGSRDYGKMMHDIISRVERIEDLDDAVNEAIVGGQINSKEKTEIELFLRERLSQKNVLDWYSGKYRILNEVPILCHKSHQLRPDRVMLDDKNSGIIIDYKFGETEDRKYIYQLQSYKKSLMQMNLSSVEAYIFYVTLNKIVKV